MWLSTINTSESQAIALPFQCWHVCRSIIHLNGNDDDTHACYVHGPMIHGRCMVQGAVLYAGFFASYPPISALHIYLIYAAWL